MNNLKKNLSYSISSDFFDAVKFYLVDDVKLRQKIKIILSNCVEWDLCHVEDSQLANQFKREILFHVYYAAWHYRHIQFDYHSDICAARVAARIERSIESWYNYGA